MLFKMLALGCEPIAVAIIDAPDLAAAVTLAASKFAKTPDDQGIREFRGRTSGYISFKGFIYGDDVGEAVDLGDVRGDIPTSYSITPLGEGNYIKTGVYAD